MSELNPRALDLYLVEFVRHPGDLGVSTIVCANCDAMARLEAWRLFPEHKRLFSQTLVHLLDYVEIDWQSGRCFVMKRRKRLAIPLLAADEPKPRRE